MADDYEALGAIAAIAGGILGLYLLYLAIVYIALPIVVVLTSGGVILGGGNAVYNYFLAFRNNVKPERI